MAKTILRDKKHLEAIARLPCCRCGNTPCEAAHIRVSTDGGAGLKPSDNYTVPLCHKCHTKQHSSGEKTFWKNELDDAIELAKELYGKTYNDGLYLISGFRMRGWGYV